MSGMTCVRNAGTCVVVWSTSDDGHLKLVGVFVYLMLAEQCRENFKYLHLSIYLYLPTYQGNDNS